MRTTTHFSSGTAVTLALVVVSSVMFPISAFTVAPTSTLQRFFTDRISSRLSTARLVASSSSPSFPSSSSVESSSSNSNETTTTTVTAVTSPTDSDDDGSAAFFAECRQLCQARNLPLQKIKNARDLASVRHSPIRPGRIFRTGRLSDASLEDLECIQQQAGGPWKTLVDLRSPTELKDDPTLLRVEVFGNYTNIVWKDQGRNKDGCLRELSPGEFPVRPPFWKRGGGNNNNNSGGGARPKTKATATAAAAAAATVETVIQSDLLELALEVDDDDDDDETELKLDDDIDEDELCTIDCEDPASLPATKAIDNERTKNRPERHFVSVMNEFKYVKGTVGKVRKRDITKAILKSPGALVSRRVRSSVKKPFLDEINGGGLPMLNELLLRYGAPGIKYVLELVADRNRHPIAFYCTAGKDRTGIIAAIILALCKVPPEDIVQDYSLSANVYAEMNDHTAMVGALSQRSLDPKTFLGAPPQVMRDTLENIEREYGSVEGYCTWIGFGPDKQEKLRRACMDE